MAKLSHVEARKARAMEELNAKLDFIMAKLGIEYKPDASAPAVEVEAEQPPAVEVEAEQPPAVEVEAVHEPKSRKGK